MKGVRPLGSVRVQTTLVATAAVGVALVLGAWAVVTVLEHSLVEGVQNTLDVRSADVVAQARLGTLPEHPSLPGQPVTLVQVVDPSGRVIAASTALQDKPPIGPFRDRGGPSVAWSQRLTADDEAYRIVSISTATTNVPVTIYAAASLETASDSVTRVKVALALGLPILLMVVAAACWWIVGRSLRPVEDIRRQVSEIRSGALDRRVPEPPAQDEVGRLARTMNEMLDRIQASSDRQRRFVADASHELRSPIASLRTQIEVQQAYADPGDGQAETLSSQLAEVSRMERLVSDLLLLARGDERKLTASVRLVPLHQVVFDEVGRAPAKDGVRVDTSDVGAMTVLGDPEGLARVVRNLLENAHRHARTRVEVSLRKEGDRASLRVSNDGAQIPSDARERIFQRFTRLDESRDRGKGGSGLGLAIAREVVAAHDGRIEVEDGALGPCFVVKVPLDGPHAMHTA